MVRACVDPDANIESDYVWFGFERNNRALDTRVLHSDPLLRPPSPITLARPAAAAHVVGYDLSHAPHGTATGAVGPDPPLHLPRPPHTPGAPPREWGPGTCAAAGRQPTRPPGPRMPADLHLDAYPPRLPRPHTPTRNSSATPRLLQPIGPEIAA